MRNLIYFWRFYSYGREPYHESMSKLFINNLASLRQINHILAVLATVFAVFPLVIEKDLIKTGVCLAVAFFALMISLYTNYKMQTTATNRAVYVITLLYYFNLTLLGIYMCIFAAQIAASGTIQFGGFAGDRLASIYLCILVISLMMFVNSPMFNLGVTLCGMVVFLSIAIAFKTPAIYKYDIVNVIIAGTLSLYFNWHITKLRIGLELSTSMLEEEKNKYLNQSTVDELTQLRNRRDYMQTFQRFITNYRASDEYFCVAVADIDFFKNYNDHYGHPTGDECLRSIGGALNQLKDNFGVYAARVGGEEFSLLWFEKEASHVENLIQNMIKTIRELKVPHEKSKVSEYVTMSIGVYMAKCRATNEVQNLYDLADKALYHAKGSGRNCAVITGEDVKQYKITPEI